MLVLQAEMLMKLSTHGLVPNLVDYLRVWDQQPEMLVLGMYNMIFFNPYLTDLKKRIKNICVSVSSQNWDGIGSSKPIS